MLTVKCSALVVRSLTARIRRLCCKQSCDPNSHCCEISFRRCAHNRHLRSRSKRVWTCCSARTTGCAPDGDVVEVEADLYTLPSRKRSSQRTQRWSKQDS